MNVFARPIFLFVLVGLLYAYKRKPRERTITSLWNIQVDFKSCVIKCHLDSVCACFKFKPQTNRCNGYPGSVSTSGVVRHGNIFNFCKRYVCFKASGYTWVPRCEMCIRVGINPKTWPESRRACKADHGDLAVLNSKLKTKSIRHFLYTLDPKLWTKMGIGMRLWIGMHRRSSSTYSWINGATGYTAWARQDPNFGEEECVMIYKRGVADAKCWLSRFYLCQLQ